MCLISSSNQLPRLARLSDDSRIAVVAAAGFHRSPVFQFQRPWCNEYPRDTVANYRVEYQLAIFNPSMIVIVVEDTVEINEGNSVYDALKEIYPPLPDNKSERVIVGVASVDVTRSSWAEHFMPEGLWITIPIEAHALNVN